jgi:ectoine hydroxylase-related dioxygenase (phytanoyl-CoA dioxygenase family)
VTRPEPTARVLRRWHDLGRRAPSSPAESAREPPGTKAIGFHQDSSYADYLVPPEMVTCWMSLHETQADAGPIAYVRGSNHWPWTPPERSQFHAPDDWLGHVRESMPPGAELELVYRPTDNWMITAI